MKVAWNSSMESGNPIIDSQHKELFTYINSYFESTHAEYSHEVVVKTLNFLVKYVRYHFSSEEELMRESHYKEYKSHVADHRKIVENLMNCYKKLITFGNNELISQELGNLLQIWFVEHIMGHDIPLAKHLKTNV